MQRHPWIILLVLLTIASTTQLWVWVTRPKEPEHEFVGPPRADYTLTDFQLHVLNIEGKLSFTLIAPRLVQRGDDSSINVDSPYYEIVDSKGNAWKGKSDSAWVNKDGSLLKLEGAVNMHRDSTETVKAAEITTHDITAWPKEQRMETAALTTITQPGTILHSVGMKADFTLKVMELLADVHTTLQPKNSRK